MRNRTTSGVSPPRVARVVRTGQRFRSLEVRDTGRATLIPGIAWRKKYLDMPTLPAFAMAEILARKVKEIEPGAVAWPLATAESETRSQQYPLSGLRPSRAGGGSQ